MDYEKEYKEARERATKVIMRCRPLSTEANLAVHYALSYVFPATTESEDERIRKEIIGYLKSKVATAEETELLYFKRWIAYLEKQKDNKFAPRVLPCSATWFEDGENFEQKEHKTIQSKNEREYVRILKSIIADFIRDKKPEDVSFYQQIYDWLDGRHIEQKPTNSEKPKEKPLTGIYWHAIKEGDTLPCRAYLWTTNYEKYHDCLEGRLIPNVENVTVGADMWYLPVDDIRTLPREGIDELPKEQEFTGRSIAEKNTDTVMSYIKNDDSLVRFKKQDELRDLLEKPIEQKPAEWSDEDKDIINEVASILINDENRTDNKREEDRLAYLAERIQSLRPQPKQESAPIEIKFAGKIYKVYGTKELPGGVIGYIIEDEPGHYDCIIHPDEVLGGGYGIKSNGSPYPTKEANFSQPHWKPSEEQMEALFLVSGVGAPKHRETLKSLYNDLKKLI